MDLLYGALGALFVLALLLAGALLGWFLRGAAYRRTAEKPKAEELRRLAEEQAAFRQLQNYNAETAYGTSARAAYETFPEGG